MAIVINKTTNLDASVQVDNLTGMIFTNEGEAHQFVITCLHNGSVTTLTGTITARFMRANNTTVLLAGADHAKIENGKAVVTLHKDCYNVPGRFQIAIFNTVGDVTTCIYAGVGNAQRTENGELIDSGEAIPSLDALLAQIEACRIATTQAETAAASVPALICPVFHRENPYGVGEFVYYADTGKIYRINEAHEANTDLDFTKVSEAPVGNELDEIKRNFAVIFEPSVPFAKGAYTYYQADNAVYRFNNAHTGAWTYADVVRVTVGDELTRIANETESEITNLKSAISVSKNLYTTDQDTVVDGKYIIFDAVVGEVLPTGGSSQRSVHYTNITVRAGTTYTLSFKSVAGTSGTVSVAICDADHVLLDQLVTYSHQAQFVTFTPAVGGLVVFDVFSTSTDIMLEKNNEATEYQVGDSALYGLSAGAELKKAVKDDEFRETQSIVNTVASEFASLNSRATYFLDHASVSVPNLLNSAEVIDAIGVEYVYENGNIDITVTESGAYKSVQFKRVPVASIDNIMISLTQINNAVFRIGHMTGNQTTWIKSISEYPASIDVSAYDYLNIAIYVNGVGTEVAQGDTASVQAVFVSEGSTPVVFPGTTAIDYNARNEIATMQNEVYPDGNKDYFGKRIVLSTENVVYKCNHETWKDFRIADMPEIASYNLWDNQSLAIFNDIVFLFKNGGYVTALDYTTKEFIGDFTISGSGHANSAQFTDIYYDENDTFPLLLISKCGNSNTTSGETDGRNDSALIYRVETDGTGFTFTQVYTIVLNVSTFGTSWYYDPFTHRISTVYPKAGNWSVQENNPNYIATFQMPDVLNGEETVFTENDAISVVKIPQIIAQGGFAENGMIYMGMQDLLNDSKSSLWVIDAVTGTLCSRLVLVSTKECEGVCKYKNKLYTSQRSGADRDSVYPLTISEYTF